MIQQTVFPFKLEITKERLTAHAGLALMSEFNHGIGLRELTDKYLPEPGSNRGYSASVFVDSVVTMLQGGGKTLEDVRELENESELMKLIRTETVPDPDTIGDWLRRMGDPEKKSKGLKGLDKVRKTINKRILRRDGIKEYTLDADAVEITGEKYEALRTYKGNKGYMPMLGFLYETKICLYDEFREGNVSPSADQKNFYEECKKRMPLGKKIRYYRADSASYNSALINKLEDDGVKFGITADQTGAMINAIARIKEKNWYEPESGCGYEVAETIYSMEKTKKAYRVAVKRKIIRQRDLFRKKEEYKYHAISTNWPEEEKDTYEVIKWHNQRGQAENFNKELKNGFGMEYMPCGQSYANAVFFRIGVVAYNLFQGFKRLSCPEAWEKHTISTFRWKMVQTAGRIVKHAGVVILKLAVDVEKLEIFRTIRKKCYELSLCPEG